MLFIHLLHKKVGCTEHCIFPKHERTASKGGGEETQCQPLSSIHQEVPDENEEVASHKKVSTALNGQRSKCQPEKKQGKANRQRTANEEKPSRPARFITPGPRDVILMSRFRPLLSSRQFFFVDFFFLGRVQTGRGVRGEKTWLMNRTKRV